MPWKGNKNSFFFLLLLSPFGLGTIPRGRKIRIAWLRPIFHHSNGSERVLESGGERKSLAQLAGHWNHDILFYNCHPLNLISSSNVHTLAISFPGPR